ncbi:transmembrane protein 272-like [Anthonomus grandis grandis]|uniref:transmembrane protein 272-like n=1 Tax=Anthonomus grandis grandis TaxID=2921223 RepID=UPI0021657CF5|nr:transmembrane protein 272-like [Anthonomus grandis grandis]
MADNAKEAENSETDIEKAKNENNNHFSDEKTKERAPPGINGSLVFLYALFFSVFTVGVINVNRCPLNRLIPIYLILAGILGALAKFLSKFDNKYCFWITVILVLVNLFWHGLGSFVVYKEYQPSYESTDELYCNRTTYLVAFWTLTIEYTLLVFFILLSGCYVLMRKDFFPEKLNK